MDLYLIVPLSPWSASVSFALANRMPTICGTLTVGMVVGKAVDVLGKVVATVGNA